ncbi:MAG: hypothetical protein ABIG30_00340 [Candidatus Aenigmatarchaeota archaeon]
MLSLDIYSRGEPHPEKLLQRLRDMGYASATIDKNECALPYYILRFGAERLTKFLVREIKKAGFSLHRFDD